MNTTSKNDSLKSGGSGGKGAGKQPQKGKEKAKASGSTKSDEYVGHTPELGDFLITNEGNKVSQFKDLMERLSTYASTEYSPEVADSIDNLKTFTMRDFMPEPLDETLWMDPSYDENGAPIIGANGQQVFIENTAVKNTLKSMHMQLINTKTKGFSEYKTGLRAMFRTTMGQLDKDIRGKIQSYDSWERVKLATDTISLLNLLRDLCYQDSKTTVHGMTNAVRAQRKLITSRQRDDDCAAFVREVQDRFKVFTALGGSVLMPAVVQSSLEHENITLSEYNLLSDLEQGPYNRRAEQRYLAAIIIEGSKDDNSILKERLAQQYTLGADQYPHDPTRALDMLIQFQGTKQKPQKKGGNGNGGEKGTDKGKRDKGDGTSKGTGTTAASKTDTKSRDLQGAQVLLAGLATNERFNHTEAALFIQMGHVSTPYNDEPSVCDGVSVASIDDWDFWLDKDDSRNQEHDPAPTLKDVNYDNIDTICVNSNVSTHVSTLSNDISHATLNRSEKRSTPAVIAQPQPANSKPSTLEREKQTTAVRAEKTPTTQRPDPPGVSYNDLHASRRRENPRSGSPRLLEGDWTGNSRSVERHTHFQTAGWNNIAALDLATTKWQRNMILKSEHFSYSKSAMHMFAQHRGGIDPHWILLDSESSVNLIVNSDLLENIRIAPNGCSLTVHCNAGETKTNLIGELRGFGTVWYYENGIANVISLGLVTNKFRVTMDSEIDNALYVHKPNGEIRRFARGGNNLYYYDVREANSGETLLTITTVEGNKQLFSGADRKRAERAMKLQEIMWYPSDQEFLKMIDNKVMKNCPITRRDVKLARQIYGKSRAMLQGKTVRKQVPHVSDEISEVPESVLLNYKLITLSIDIFHVNGVRFLGTIARHLRYRTVRGLTNMKKSSLLAAVKAVIGQYELRGFQVQNIFADNQFECLREDLLELSNPVNLNTAATDEHEPFIERSNRTVKDRIRCAFNNTPFKRMPARMIMEMVYSAVFWLNSTIPEEGVMPTMSPLEIMTGVGLDATKHARFQFGEYVMAHEDETNNSMDPRALDTVFLRPSGNIQGGYYALDLNTGKRIHRMHGTSLPMTEAVIRRVDELADAQEAPFGLIFGDSNNDTTILDIELDENIEDDDASDGEFVPSDEESVESTASYITEATEVSDAVDERDIIPQEEENNVNNNVERDDEPEGLIAGDDEAAQVSEHEETDDDVGITPEPGEETTDDQGATASESGEIDDEEPSDVPTKRAGLRPSVRRTHNKFGEQDGFAPSVIHRGSMFTAGYGPAIEHIRQQEIGHIHTASAIAQYNNIEASQVTKQYGVREGIKRFGEEGVDAVLAELQQIHDRTVMVPMDPAKMTKEMRDQALPYLMFLKRKRCGKIKGRGCADGRRQREFISKEEASSPTVSLHALMVSCLIDAIEERDVATVDIPGAFLQTEMPEGEDVYIRLDGTMAELLCRLDPELYEPCMIETKSGRKILYAKAKKAIYGTLRAALLFWENLSGKLSDWGFVQNPYDACTMNHIINGSQATICWHVDDLKISHKDPNVVSEIIDKLDSEYGKISPLTIKRGQIHDYVGMTIDYSIKGQVRFSMFDYLEEMIQNIPSDFKGESQTPAGNHLFTVNEDAEKLSDDHAEVFHHYVAKLLFMAKRTRPDIVTAVAFLCTRVKSPDVHDWKKLARVMKYLQTTPFIPLCLGWDGTGDVNWYVDASFAVHADMRSHTGGMMTLGQGAVISVSTKQKINTKSSTEAELVGVDDVLNLEIWVRHFLNAQYNHAGTDVLMKTDRLHQDNTSAMKLEKNGKASSTKRTRHIDIRYFFITDRIKAGHIDLEYCPTDEMLADFFTKPLQGSKFRFFRNKVMGIADDDYLAFKDAYYKAKRDNKESVSSVFDPTGRTTSEPEGA